MTTKKKKIGPGRRPIDPAQKRISVRVWMTVGDYEKIYFGERHHVQDSIDYDIEQKKYVQALCDAALSGEITKPKSK